MISQFCTHPDRPSFHSAKEMKYLIENLPSGPKWNSTELAFGSFGTHQPIVFFWRDALKCVQFIFENQLFADAMEYAPYRLYNDESKSIRYYSGIMSADWIWDVQVSFFLIRPGDSPADSSL
jgi:hypothetical protein